MEAVSEWERRDEVKKKKKKQQQGHSGWKEVSVHVRVRVTTHWCLCGGERCEK